MSEWKGVVEMKMIAGADPPHIDINMDDISEGIGLY